MTSMQNWNWDTILVLGLALLLDLILGEPPLRFHPTAWMGRLIEVECRIGKKLKPSLQKAYGVMLAIGVIGVFAAGAYLFLQLVDELANEPIRIIITAFLLKSTFSIKMMCQCAASLASAIRQGDYVKARSILKSIVRRDPASLSNSQVISAGVESVAESTGDGIVSPLFYYALFGVLGAVAYRAINTLDSMVGYRDSEFINLGWFSAKLDSIANWLPARLAAILMIFSGALLGASFSRSWRILVRDRDRTESWNAGWLMSAMAGLLGVRLEKPGFYILGDADQQLNYAHVTKAIHIMFLDVVLFLLTLILFMIVSAWASDQIGRTMM